MNKPVTNPAQTKASDADWSLPAWLYNDPEFFAAETAKVMRPSWQVVCHVSDVAGVGDYHTFDFLGESVLVIRGEDGVIRAMANVCRHRGSRLVDGSSGCARKLVCPYHAWSYELDGRLTGVPMRGTYPSLVMENLSLPSLDCEIYHGFIFVRLETGGPSVAEMMAPYTPQIEPYKFEDLRAIGRVTLRPRPVNWKNVSDNYSDGLHIKVAHPGLTRLFGRSYGVEAKPMVDKMWGEMMDKPSSNLSERAYQKLLPRVDHLPEANQKLWLYFKLWPNVAFDIYPDQVDFMQFLPISPTETLIREISYAIPDGRREMRAARYLNWRINRQVNAEDTVLIERVQHGMASPSFSVGPLSDTEVCLRSFCAKIRDLIPESRQAQPPAPGWSQAYTHKPAQV